MRQKQKAEQESERVWQAAGYYYLYNLCLENKWIGSSMEDILNAPFEDLLFHVSLHNIVR
jgi:hypothetical protein